jgi:clan AA aspartic protease (TIGR02281 family)
MRQVRAPGRRPMARGFGVMAAVALTIASAAPARSAAVCQMQEVGELPIQFDHGRLLVEARIDGRPAKMIVDTGATNTLIFGASAEALGLRIVPIPGVKFYGVGGESGAGQVRIADFRVANLVARDEDLLVSGKQPLGAEQGLLGADFLLQADLEFDVAGGKLRFFRPMGCSGDTVVYWGKAYSAAHMVGSGAVKQIMVTVQVNGAPVRAEIDTGAPGSILTPAAAARAGVTQASKGISEAQETRGLGARSVRTYVGVFSSFSFGDETIRNAQLRIADLFAADKEVKLGSHIPESAIEAPDMLLGADFVRSHRVYVSRGQRMVYVSYVGGPVFRTGAPPPSAR